MEAHPLADTFPMMTNEEITDLANSIKEHGLREPVTIYDGKILDGRNRVKACEIAGIRLRSEELPDDADALAFVIDKNLKRRHLNAGQRAMIASALTNIPRDISKKTYIKQQAEQAGENSPAPVLTNDEAAALFGISRDTIKAARVIRDHGTPEEAEDVQQGRVAISKVANAVRKRNKKRPTSHGHGAPKKSRPPVNQNKIRASVWKDFKAALEALAGLPLPADVVDAAHHYDRGGVVNRLLDQSINYLETFKDAWNQTNN